MHDSFQTLKPTPSLDIILLLFDISFKNSATQLHCTQKDNTYCFPGILLQKWAVGS